MTRNTNIPQGLGDPHAKIKVYIGNRPPLSPFQAPASITPLEAGDIDQIVAEGGNHWRKIFVIYAKLMQRLSSSASLTTWQRYRETSLLRANSGAALIFSPLSFSKQYLQLSPSQSPRELDSAHIPITHDIHIVAGKNHALTLGLGEELEWLDPYFAVSNVRPVIVSPYFDYRQLSNARIDQLVALITQLDRGAK